MRPIVIIAWMGIFNQFCQTHIRSDIIYGSYVVSKICISTHGFMTLGSITLGYSTYAFLYAITEFSTRAVILRTYLASHYARAGHSQMESVIRYVTYKIKSITVKGANVENA